jgi:hypothetical protein
VVDYAKLTKTGYVMITFTKVGGGSGSESGNGTLIRIPAVRSSLSSVKANYEKYLNNRIQHYQRDGGKEMEVDQQL